MAKNTGVLALFGLGLLWALGKKSTGSPGPGPRPRETARRGTGTSTEPDPLAAFATPTERVMVDGSTAELPPVERGGKTDDERRKQHDVAPPKPPTDGDGGKR